jgi:hypothetical protein
MWDIELWEGKAGLECRRVGCWAGWEQVNTVSCKTALKSKCKWYTHRSSVALLHSRSWVYRMRMWIKTKNHMRLILLSYAPLPFCQSLDQMNVPHRHSVPFSFCPLGPNGLAHIQKLRP